MAIGSINAALAVILGAFGAHALKARLSPQMLEVYHTAVQYHFYHALGMLLVAALAVHMPQSSGAMRFSGYLMLAGIILFSGSLYVLAMTGVTWLGAITPMGGLCFIAAWIVLAMAALRDWLS